MAGAAILVVITLWWVTRSTSHDAHTDSSSRVVTTTPTAGSRVSGDSPPEPTPSRAPTQAIRISREQRLEMAKKIEAARARRPAAGQTPVTTVESSASGSTDTNRMNTAEDVLAELQAIARELESATDDCTRKYAPGIAGFQTELTLLGDPDIGTLIDASTPVLDKDGAPLPRPFDDCMRDAFQTLALPPMKNGDKYTVTYSSGI